MQWGAHRDQWARLETTGVLEEKLVDHVWRDHIDQKAMLLGLMDKFDLICERLPRNNVSTVCFTTRPTYFCIIVRSRYYTKGFYNQTFV